MRRVALLIVGVLVGAALVACSGDDASYDLLFVSGSSLYSVRDDGSDLRLLREGDDGEVPAYSPDGAWVAFGCAEDGALGLPWTAVCVERIDGSDARTILAEEYVVGGFLRRADWSAGDIAWSRDGSRIAFTVVEEIAAGIFTDGDVVVYDVASDATTVIDEGKAASSRLWLRWSPDGRYIASVRSATVGSGVVLQILATDGEAVSLDAGDVLGVGTIEMYAWAPDSSGVAFTWNDFSGTTSLYVAAPEDGSSRRVGEAWGGEPPVWSGDSRRIAASRVPGGTGFTQLFVMEADGSGERQVGENMHSTNSPAFSHDGRSLAFRGSASESETGSRFPPGGVYRVELDGGVPVRLTGDQPLAFDALINWALDSDRIFYAAQGATCMEGCPPGLLFFVNTDGGAEPVAVSGDIVVSSILGWVER